MSVDDVGGHQLKADFMNFTELSIERRYPVAKE